MLQEKLLLLVLDRLNSLQIPYMLTGSVAVSYYGVPRSTHDIDFVVELHQKQIPLLLKAFQKEFYINDTEILDALTNKSMFNLIHRESGIKVDFWILDPNNDYQIARFERRTIKDYFGNKVHLVSAEDLILVKLLWTKDAPSERHRNDIQGIFLVQGTKLDRSYMESWAKKISVINALQTFLN